MIGGTEMGRVVYISTTAKKVVAFIREKAGDARTESHRDPRGEQISVYPLDVAHMEALRTERAQDGNAFAYWAYEKAKSGDRLNRVKGMEAPLTKRSAAVHREAKERHALERQVILHRDVGGTDRTTRAQE